MSTAPEKTYRRFLLGIASEEEESRAEEAILTGRVDASFLHDLEDEIIDDYLLGNITSDERDGFTEKFLAMEERRKRVAFAAWLIEYARKNSAEEPSVEPTPARARDFLGLFSWKTAALFATAACVLVAILAGNEHFKLRRQIQLASPMRNERAGALDRVSGKIEELSQADLLRSESSSPSNSASDHLLVAQGAKPNSKSALVSIPDLTALLMPTIEFAASTRSVYPTLVRIPARAQFVRIELKLPLPLADRYREVILAPNGQQLWAQEFPASVLPAGQRSTIVLPSSILPTGLYHFQVERAAAEGQFEPLEDHVFRVTKE